MLEHLACRLHADDRQAGRIEQAELHEHGRLVPVDVLVRELAVAEMNDDNQPWRPDDHDRSFRTASAALTPTLRRSNVPWARAAACAAICWAVSNRFPGVASGADRPTYDASDAGLDAPAIQHDARALASEVTLAAGNSKSSFSEIRTLVAGAVDRETEWRARNRCPL